MQIKDRARVVRLAESGRSAEAVQLLNEIATKNNDAEAYYALASWRLNEAYGESFDIEQAEKLLNESVKLGFPAAFHDLAAIRLRSNEHRRFKDAFGLLLIGAILGDKDSVFRLIECLENGHGCFKDPETANLLRSLV